MRARRWAAAGTAVAAAAAAATAAARGGDGRPPVRVRDLGVYGLSVQASVSLTGHRTLLGGTLRLGGADAPVSFHPDGSPDGDAAPVKAMDLPAGTPVGVSAQLRPPCAAATGTLTAELVLRTRSDDGREATDRVRLRTPDDARDVLRGWCAAGVRAAVPEFSAAPDGRARVMFLVSNPGPATVTVDSPRWSAGQVTWFPARVTVPGGQALRLAVRGRIPCGSGTAPGPWDSGRLVVRTGGTTARLALDERPDLIAGACR